MVGVKGERTVPKEVSQLSAADEDGIRFGLYGRPFELDSRQRLADERNRLPDVVDDLKEHATDAVGRSVGVEADGGGIIDEVHQGASGYGDANILKCFDGLIGPGHRGPFTTLLVDHTVEGGDDSRVLGDETAKIVGEAKEGAKTGVVFRAREVKNGFYLRLRHR